MQDQEFWIGVCESLDEAKRRDAAFEAVRQKLIKMQRHSFFLGNNSILCVSDKSGRWIDFDEVHNLFDPVFVDSAVRNVGKEHVTDGSPCWCNPKTDYIDQETKVAVIVHNK